MERIDCLVVGAGPAGLVGALYLRRYHRRVRLADAGASRARWIDRSHNCPGFPAGVGGPELLARLREQLAEVGGEVVAAEVDALTRDGDGFAARVGGDAVRARSVLLATGVVDRVPPLAGIDAARARGLLRQCPICDGHEHRGRRIAVLGDGEHARREARFIAHYSDHVTLVGLAVPAAEAADEGIARAAAVARAVALPTGGGVRLAYADGRHEDFDVLYAALGVDPRSALAAGLGATLDDRGAVVVDARCRTGVDGLWAAGDVVSALDQIAVACGHGAIAATDIHNALT